MMSFLGITSLPSRKNSLWSKNSDFMIKMPKKKVLETEKWGTKSNRDEKLIY